MATTTATSTSKTTVSTPTETTTKTTSSEVKTDSSGKTASTTTTTTVKKRPAAQICDIVGNITDIESAQDSSWQYNVPTQLDTSKNLVMQISVEARNPHDSKTLAANCKRRMEKETRTYKLCSVTKVKVGDRIQGTEGIDTGSRAVGCLFDLVVLPKS